MTTDLSERDVVRVAVDQEATVLTEALGIEIPGRVALIASEATTLGGDVVYEVVIELAVATRKSRYSGSTPPFPTPRAARSEGRV